MYLKGTVLNLEHFIIKLRRIHQTCLISSPAQMFSSRRRRSDKIGFLKPTADGYLSNGLILLCSFPSLASARNVNNPWIVQSDTLNMNLRKERVPLSVLEGQISLIFLITIQTKDLLTSIIIESILTLWNQCGRSWCKLWLKDSSWLRVQATWFIHQVLLTASHSFH